MSDSKILLLYAEVKKFLSPLYEMESNKAGLEHLLAPLGYASLMDALNDNYTFEVLGLDNFERLLLDQLPTTLDHNFPIDFPVFLPQLGNAFGNINSSVRNVLGEVLTSAVANMSSQNRETIRDIIFVDIMQRMATVYLQREYGLLFKLGLFLDLVVAEETDQLWAGTQLIREEGTYRYRFDFEKVAEYAENIFILLNGLFTDTESPQAFVDNFIQALGNKALSFMNVLNEDIEVKIDFEGISITTADLFYISDDITFTSDDLAVINLDFFKKIEFKRETTDDTSSVVTTKLYWKAAAVPATNHILSYGVGDWIFALPAQSENGVENAGIRIAKEGHDIEIGINGLCKISKTKNMLMEDVLSADVVITFSADVQQITTDMPPRLPAPKLSILFRNIDFDAEHLAFNLAGDENHFPLSFNSIGNIEITTEFSPQTSFYYETTLVLEKFSLLLPKELVKKGRLENGKLVGVEDEQAKMHFRSLGTNSHLLSLTVNSERELFLTVVQDDTAVTNNLEIIMDPLFIGSGDNIDGGMQILTQEIEVDVSQQRQALLGGISIAEATLFFSQDMPQFITVSGQYDDGAFAFQSTGEIRFGNGLTLYPIELSPTETKPILDLQVQSDSFFQFAVAGQLKVPHANGEAGLKGIEVTGQLSLAFDTATDAWRLTEFAASGQATGDWPLPGDIVVEELKASVAYSQDRFSAGIGGQICLDTDQAHLGMDGKLTFRNGDSTNIILDIALSGENLTILDQAYLFGLETQLHVQTHNEAGSLAPSGFIAVKKGTLGLFPEGSIGTTPTSNQFLLVTENLQARFDLNTIGFALALNGGDLLLPPIFHAGAGGRASASLSDGQDDLSLEYKHDVGLMFAGSILFKDFVFLSEQNDPSSTPMAVRLQRARLVLPTVDPNSVVTLPYLKEVNGELELPLTKEQKLSFALTEGKVRLNGLPLGTGYLINDVNIPLDTEEKFVFVIHGTAVDSPTHLAITYSDNNYKLVVATKTSLKVDAEFLTDAKGDAIRLSGGGEIQFTQGEIVPTFNNMKLEVGGEFHIGGANGLYIHGRNRAPDASISASGIEHILQPSEQEPFEIALTGSIQLPNKGPSGGLNNARFIFDGSDTPTFNLDGISGGTGDMLAGKYLPIKITELGLQFGEGDLPDKLSPLNTTITVSAEMLLMDGMTGGISGLGVGLDADGRLKFSLGALFIEVADMEMATFKVSGGMAVGGLSGNSPQDLVLAGKMGGKMNGAGFDVLVAMGVKEYLPDPLGLSIDVSLGQVGIPLWASGFLLTGVQGGISYTGSNADPDELQNYITIDDNTKTVTKGTIPATTPADVPKQQQTDTAGSKRPNQTQTYKCPDEPCPPPSVGILYEPHPDQEAYPHRVIYKFSALDANMVDALLQAAGLSPAALANLSAKAIGDSLAATVVGMLNLDNLFPQEALALFREQFSGMIEQTAVSAFNGQTSVYDAIVTAAYKGLEADNANVKLTGTLSYTGLSTFLSVTGGVVISPTDQSAGIVGNLNLLGISVGKLRGFLTVNNEQGLPDPALCGDLDVALGPLELGRLRTTMRYGIDFVGVAADIANLIGTLSTTLIDQIFTTVDAALYQANNNDPVAMLNDPALAPEQISALMALLMEQTPTAAITQFFADLTERLWARYNPEFTLCGSAQPKLFGLPLDKETVGISGMVGKTAPDEDIFLAASFRCSPTGILSKIFFGILPGADQMTFSYRLGLPSPVPLIQAGMMADFNSENGMIKHTARGINHVLDNGIATIDYEIAPLGLKLLKSKARMLSPNLLDHPAHPKSRWKRPEDRRGGYPSRLAVILAALDDKKLADPSWLGTAVDIQELSPFKNKRWREDLSLREDYFPHGGILGAAWLALPKIMLHAPNINDYVTLIQPSSQMNERIEAAGRILKTIVTPEEIGRLAFYVPAPNPPMIAFRGNRKPKPARLLALQQQHPFNVDDMEVAELYSFSESFVKGEIGNRDKPVTLLGVPVGHGDIELRPGGHPQKPEGFFRIRADIPQDSWLQAFLGSAKITGIIRNKPTKSIEKTFKAIQRGFRSQRTDKAKLINTLADSLISQMPKMSLRIQAEFHVPEELELILATAGQVDASFHAYSLLYSPNINGTNVVDKARKNGGIAMVLSGNLKIGQSFGFDITGSNIEMALFPSALLFPGVAAHFSVEQVGLPFGLPVMESADVDFNIEAGDWLLPDSMLSIKGKINGNDLLIELGNDNHSPYLDGSLSLDMDFVGDIGPIYKPGSNLKLLDTLSLDTRFRANVTFRSRINGGEMWVRKGRFSWNNKTWRVPDFTVQASVTTQTELVTKILQEITTNGFELFNTMLNNADSWFNALNDGLIHLSNQTAQNLAEILKTFHQSVNKTAKKLGKLFDDVQVVIETLFNVFPSSMTEVLDSLRGAGFNQSQAIADAMHALYPNQYTSQLAKLFYNNWDWNNPVRNIVIRFKAANYTLNQTIKALKSISSISLSAIIKAVYDKHTENMTTVLNKIYAAGFKNSQDIADAMYLKYQGSHAKKVAKLFYDNWDWNNPANTVANRFEKANYSIGETIEALFSLGVFTMDEMIKAIKAAWGTSVTVLEDMFNGLMAVYNDPYTITLRLIANGFNA